MTSIRNPGRPLRKAVAIVIVTVVIAALGALVTAAHAQPTNPAQPAPPTVLPGAIERQFQVPPQPRARPDVIQLPQAQQRPPAGTESVRLGVKRIALEGALALDAATVRALIEPLEGRDVSFAELVELANALTVRYRDAGFILAQVVVPEQRIDPVDAVVRLQAFEGFIDEVRFSGDVGSDGARLDALANAIQGKRPLTALTLERYLLLLNDIPGLRAATTITPSLTQAGAADLEIRLTRRAVAGELAIDNRGSPAAGPWRMTADVEAFGLLGTSRTAAKLATTGNRELLFGSLQHEQTINREGTKIVLTGSTAQSRPNVQASFGSLILETESRSVGLSIQHPMIRARSQNVYVRVGFTGYNGETRANATLTSDDRIRAVRLGLAWDQADSFQGLNIADVEFSRGLPRLGATALDDPNRSRVSGRSDFTKATFYAARLQSVARRWSVLLAATGQYARSDLLAPELFAAGGEQFGRGYDPSELLGDNGAAAKVELRYTDTTARGWLANYTLYAFYDAAVVRRRTPVNETVQASLASTGLGVRFGTEQQVSGFLEVAQPLTRPVASRSDRDTRTQAGVAAKF